MFFGVAACKLGIVYCFRVVCVFYNICFFFVFVTNIHMMFYCFVFSGLFI